MKNFKWRIGKWWNGESITHGSSISEYTILAIKRGFKEKPKRLVSRIKLWVKANWKWLVTTAIALFALLRS